MQREEAYESQNHAAHEPACACRFSRHVEGLLRSICCAESQKQVSYLSKMGIFPFPFLQLDHECVTGESRLQVNDLENLVLYRAVKNC